MPLWLRNWQRDFMFLRGGIIFFATFTGAFVHAVKGQVEIAQDPFLCVLQIKTIGADGLSQYSSCSAVRVGKSRVLTTKHCFGETHSEEVRQIRGFANAETVLFCPNEEPRYINLGLHARHHQRNDLSALLLSPPYESDAPNIQLAQSLSQASEVVKTQDCYVMGWGLNNQNEAGLPLRGIVEFDSHKRRVRRPGPAHKGRARFRTVESLEKQNFVFATQVGSGAYAEKSYQFFKRSLTTSTAHSPAFSAPGDSGGPVACVDQKGNWTLIALNEAGGSLSSVSLPVYRFASWIEENFEWLEQRNSLMREPAQSH
jgi:hypothetical protein